MTFERTDITKLENHLYTMEKRLSAIEHNTDNTSDKALSIKQLLESIEIGLITISIVLGALFIVILLTLVYLAARG